MLDHDGRLVGLIVPQVEPEGGSGGRLRQRFRSEIERYGQELPSYERITDFALTAQSLPRTQIGKLRRHLLPDLYDRAKSARGPVEEATLYGRGSGPARAHAGRPGLGVAAKALQGHAPDPGHQPGARSRPRFVRVDEPRHGACRSASASG